MAMPRYLRAIGQTSAQFFQSLVPGFEDRRAGELKAAKEALERAEAYVDPSRLMASKLFVPYNPSVLVTRKGLGIFDQMKRDEQIKSCLMFKKHAILASGWEVKSPGDQEEDWEVTQFVRDTLMKLPGGMDRAVRKILLGLDYGYSVTEKIYGDAAWAPGKKPLVKLTSVKPHCFDFEVDPHGNVLSLIQRYTPGAAQEVYLPPEKFVVYQNEPEFENPYGTSDLEAAYRPWWVKDNAYKWFAVLLERYGMPPLFLFYNPNNYSGNQLEDLKKVVRNIQNSTMGLLPRQDKDALEFWSAKLASEGKEVYLAALSRFDQDIGRALLMPSLIGATSDDQSSGGKGSYARANVHFKNFLYVVGAAQRDVASNAINSQIIPQLVDLNFAGVEHYPEFCWGRLDDELELALFDTWQKLVDGKVVNRIEDDETHIRKALGFPENAEPVLEPLPEKTEPGEKGKPKAVAPEDEEDSEPIPEEEQSAEMKAFADENNGEWRRVDGEAVCVARMAEDEEDGVWRTINGRRVFIKKGESVDEALARSLERDKENPWPRNEKGERELPGPGFKIPAPPSKSDGSPPARGKPHGLVTDLLKRFPNREALTSYLNKIPNDKLQTALKAIRNGSDEDTKYIREVIKGVLKS